MNKKLFSKRVASIEEMAGINCVEAQPARVTFVNEDGMRVVKIGIEDCIDIRHRVLWPDLSRDALYMAGDDEANHYGVVKGSNVVSCLSVFRLSDSRCQIRKFATLPEYQGKGCGSLLIRSVLGEIQRQGFKAVQLDARVTASSFYSRFGFSTEGEIFQKGGIDFVLMRMNTAPCEARHAIIHHDAGS